MREQPMLSSPTTDPAVVLILGSGHSGSTLLDLLLSSHSCAFGLGEIVQIREEHTRRNLLNDAHEFSNTSTFWTPRRVSDVTRIVDPGLAGRIANRILRRGKHARLYKYFSDASGATWIIDSSKTLSWVKQALIDTSQREIRTFVIWVDRNPKGVINSFLRKYPHRGIETIIREHKKDLESLCRFYHSVEVPKRRIRYEDLASDPARTMRDICAFLGMPFEEEAISYWNHTHHHVGGNSGTKSLLLKATGKDAIRLPGRSDSQHYANHPLSIALDERWRQELTGLQQAAIDEQFSTEQPAG